MFPKEFLKKVGAHAVNLSKDSGGKKGKKGLGSNMRKSEKASE